MRVAVVYRQGMEHQVLWCGAMARGLARHGVEVVDKPQPGDPVVTWGWRQGKPWRDAGHDVLVMERGYVGDRAAWTSCGWNGLNGRALFPAVEDGGERWARLFGHLMKPWRAAGGYVLLIGQIKGDAATVGVDLDAWYREMVKVLGDGSAQIYFRPHPVEVEQGRQPTVVPGAPTMNGSLDEALAGAILVATYNSNTGVDALVAGVPALAHDEGSMIWRAPNRDAWAARLAWCQFNADEIASGLAWAHLRDIAACRRISI